MSGIWIDQSTRRTDGDRWVCGDCGWDWPLGPLGPPFDAHRCFECGGLLTGVFRMTAAEPPPIPTSSSPRPAAAGRRGAASRSPVIARPADSISWPGSCTPRPAVHGDPQQRPYDWTDSTPARRRPCLHADDDGTPAHTLGPGERCTAGAADPAAPVLGEEARRRLDKAVVMARSEGRYVVPTGDVAALDAVLDAVIPIVAALLSSAREEGERKGAAAERERIANVATKLAGACEADSHGRIQQAAYQHMVRVALVAPALPGRDCLCPSRHSDCEHPTCPRTSS
jgi:hypothetical protein